MFLAYVIATSEFVEGNLHIEAVSDPADNIYLAAAVESAADVVVSGDKHILSLGEYHGIRMLRAREFLREIELLEG